MRFQLPTRIAGTFTAAVMAITAATATPAVADDHRTARTVATIFGLAVVGALIHENNKDKHERRQTHQQQVRSKPAPRVHRHGTKTQPRQRAAPRPLPQRVNRKNLPQQCLRSFNTRNGKVRMFGRRCLEQNYKFVNRLPQNCAQRVRTHDGRRSGFGARCLRQNGYTLARR
ncbi:hypothetical protein Z948_1408 [Sulfitobacter donghicola DSW-25 = KCTC 12864 = JCM 14565]|uniref:Uncharacterized protein n=1 Tax=Sulfitobacter donghicola DSW-25 = KCTC 12864 = JCM 14565 TaxID=1300350 RepID=A0A073IYJ9_9RHOB|nr:hypothetical protein DSW25_00595 [Sulfitobacter donghicola DSW-25 = KCTC 12864 = JCM 14565]KIN67686.1 hypothetical protein Z948_1408 [Sulfitobacter donghicola DSW-25 = KCTC 12864 = JCM 14565]